MTMSLVARARVYYSGRMYHPGEPIPNVSSKDARLLLHLGKVRRVGTSDERGLKGRGRRQDRPAQPAEEAGAFTPDVVEEMSERASDDEAASGEALKPARRRYSRRDMQATD